MSSETFTYKGISAGKYVEGDIEALNQEEASFKLKEQKIIITNLVKTKKPDIIFHLAAQSLVSEGYVSPLETFESNIIGSVNILESTKKYNV